MSRRELIDEASLRQEAISLAIVLLRHRAEQHGLQLDSHGWTDLEHLLAVMNYRLAVRTGWRELTAASFSELMVEQWDRIEVHGRRVRARYGHSQPGVQAGVVASPPDQLLHGTSVELLSTIRCHGLSPQSRCDLHLTSDLSYAARVAANSAGGDAGLVLVVEAERCCQQGQVFRQANRHVWLTSAIAPRHLGLLDSDRSPKIDA